MKRKLMLTLGVSVLWLVSVTAPAALGQPAPIIKLPELQKIIASTSEPYQVVNFWATWCAPCVKELPLLEKLNAENDNVRVTLVSMDLELDPNPDKVNRFVKRKNLKSWVVILDEQNPNDWISKIDDHWSGALPATLIVNSKTGQRKLVERELHEGELEKLMAELK